MTDSPDEQVVQFSPEQRANIAQAKRNAMVANARVLIAHNPQVHYRAQRPMQNERDHMHNVIKRFHRGIGMWMDCSEAVSFICFTSGCKDPNGMNYDGWGNSHTMWQHLSNRYTDASRAHLGALGVWGNEGSEHVAMVIERDPHNPLMMSHGQEACPCDIRLLNEMKFHQGEPFTFLDITPIL